MLHREREKERERERETSSPAADEESALGLKGWGDVGGEGEGREGYINLRVCGE